MRPFRVGDIVELHNYAGKLYRVVAIYPQNSIPSPDRVDVVFADDPPTTSGVGIPIEHITRLVNGGDDEPLPLPD